MITKKADPNHVGIHNFMIALVLSRKNSPITSKILHILELVCFQITEGKIQKSELKYVFHLFYYYIEVTTPVLMKYSEIQKRVEEACFPEDGEETCPMAVIADLFGKEHEVAQLFTLYNMEELVAVS